MRRKLSNKKAKVNLLLLPEMLASIDLIGGRLKERLGRDHPFPVAPGEPRAKYGLSHVLCALLANFLDLPRDQQHAYAERGWLRMIEVYGQDEPEEGLWVRKAPPGGEGGEGEIGGARPRAEGLLAPDPAAAAKAAKAAKAARKAPAKAARRRQG